MLLQGFATALAVMLAVVEAAADAHDAHDARVAEVCWGL